MENDGVEDATFSFNLAAYTTYGNKALDLPIPAPDPMMPMTKGRLASPNVADAAAILGT